jgi:hypothetical protein
VLLEMLINSTYRKTSGNEPDQTDMSASDIWLQTLDTLPHGSMLGSLSELQLDSTAAFDFLNLFSPAVDHYY